jgi:hypothetical protein
MTLLKSVDRVLSMGDVVGMYLSLPGERPMASNSKRFNGRIFLYTEEDISESDLEILNREAEANGLHMQIRGPRYAEERARLEIPIAFISHDSRDKDEIARPLAVELAKRMCPVWYDEFSLKLGDSLRESIEKGLKECKKCILVLSKHFLTNRGWTNTEFNAVFTRELLEGKNIVLPIWCGIDKAELYEYSPTLLNRLGSKWERGLEEVVREILRVLGDK